MRYLCVDRITEIKYGSYAKGVKCVTLTEDYLEDHFQDNPIYPGALSIESLAQLGGILIILSYRKLHDVNKYAMLAKVDKMKFMQPVLPGHCMQMHAEIESMMEKAAYVKVKAEVDGKPSAQGRLMFVYDEFKDYKSSRAESYIDILTRNTRVIE